MRKTISENLANVQKSTNKVLKNEKGAITLYVSIACLIILIIRNW